MQLVKVEITINKNNIIINKTIIKCEFTETEKSVYNSYKNSIRKINEILLKICCDYTLLNLKIFKLTRFR